MTPITIWHYSRCSKSRQTLAILEDRGIDPTIRLYQDDPPTRTELEQVIQKLDIPPSTLVRKKDKSYKELDLIAEDLSDEDWIALLVQYPQLIERPIVITDQKAVIGRPPENVEKLLK